VDTATDETVSRTSIDTSYYGDLNSPFHFTIYELSDTLSSDTVYYSNMNLSNWYNSANVVYDQSIQFEGKEEALKFKMPASFFNKFLDADSTVFESDESFAGFLKGFYFKCEERTSIGGAILKLNTYSPNAMMTVYYRTNALDTLTAEFDLYGAPHANIFDKNYSNTLFESRLNQTNVQDTVTYVQSMDGLATKVIIDADDYAFLNNVVLYDARLQVRLQDTIYSKIDIYEPITTPVLLKASNDELDKEYLLEYSGSTGYSGMNRIGDLHSFTITKYFQNLIDHNDQENTGLYIYLNSPQNFANRTILRSGNNSKPMQIIVKYSILPSGK